MTFQFYKVSLFKFPLFLKKITHNNWLIIYCFLLVLIFSCKKESKVFKQKKQPKSTIKYAKGFDIVTENGNKKLIVKTPYQNSKQQFEYTIQNKSFTKKKANHINVPVNKLVVTSTTHIPMIELLNEENSIIGFPFTKYVSSSKTRKRIDNGFIKEIGKENALNTEILLDLQPELIVGFSVSGANKSLSVIQKSGIPVIYNGDWLEETPLGRAEWLKFFGILFDKEKQADSIFKDIETNYLNAKKIALNIKNKPTVVSGSMFNGVWDTPAGESFIASFFKDANLNYLWQNSKGTGSLQLSFESVFDKAQRSDYWIGCGLFETKEQFINSNKFYKEFDAFKKNKIFTVANKKGETGGIIYYELAPTRPDLVLKDLIKIRNPKLLSNYEFTFFEKLE